MIAIPPPPPAADLRARLQRLAARGIVLKSHRAANVRPIVSFTFDDVPVTSFTHGARVLDAAGAHGTFYISAGLCAAGEAAGATTPLTAIGARECRELAARGHEIGCHTFSHRHMRFCSPAALSDEIARNQAFFAAIDPGIKLENFAFPYNAPTIGSKLLLQRHFHTSRGGVPGVNSGSIDLGFLRAVELWQETCEAQIRNWIDAAAKENGWLIFFSHDINERPTRWGITPALLASAVAYAKDSGCDVASVREALALVGAAPQGAGPASSVTRS